MEADYQAYLLRLWQSNTAEGSVWRASLESVHSGERRAFADLAALFAYLLAAARQTGESDADGALCPSGRHRQ